MTNEPITLSTLREDPDRLLETADAARAFNKSKAWFEKHRWAGTGPCFVKIGRTPYYKACDLLLFIEKSRTQFDVVAHV